MEYNRQEIEIGSGFSLCQGRLKYGKWSLRGWDGVERMVIRLSWDRAAGRLSVHTRPDQKCRLEMTEAEASALSARIRVPIRRPSTEVSDVPVAMRGGFAFCQGRLKFGRWSLRDPSGVERRVSRLSWVGGVLRVWVGGASSYEFPAALKRAEWLSRKIWLPLDVPSESRNG